MGSEQQFEPSIESSQLVRCIFVVQLSYHIYIKQKTTHDFKEVTTELAGKCRYCVLNKNTDVSNFRQI